MPSRQAPRQQRQRSKKVLFSWDFQYWKFGGHSFKFFTFPTIGFDLVNCIYLPSWLTPAITSKAQTTKTAIKKRQPKRPLITPFINVQRPTLPIRRAMPMNKIKSPNIFRPPSDYNVLEKTHFGERCRTPEIGNKMQCEHVCHCLSLRIATFSKNFSDENPSRKILSFTLCPTAHFNMHS